MNTQQAIAEILISRYDYISKTDAIRVIRSAYGDFFPLSDIVKAYNSIKQYNY